MRSPPILFPMAGAHRDSQGLPTHTYTQGRRRHKGNCAELCTLSPLAEAIVSSSLDARPAFSPPNVFLSILSTWPSSPSGPLPAACLRTSRKDPQAANEASSPWPNSRRQLSAKRATNICTPCQQQVRDRSRARRSLHLLPT